MIGDTAITGTSRPNKADLIVSRLNMGSILRKGFEGQIITPDKLGSLSLSKTAGAGLACSEP